jgi:hypothetical protein
VEGAVAVIVMAERRHQQQSKKRDHVKIVMAERRHQQQSKKRDHVKIVTDRHVTKYNCPQHRTAKTWLIRLLFYLAQVVNLKTLNVAE